MKIEELEWFDKRHQERMESIFSAPHQSIRIEQELEDHQQFYGCQHVHQIEPYGSFHGCYNHILSHLYTKIIEDVDE